MGKSTTSKAPAERAYPERPDLLFATVRPIGVPDARFYEHLEARLRFFGYHPSRIKLSGLLEEIATAEGRLDEFAHPDERAKILIEEGNRVCEDAENAAAIAKLGVERIAEARGGDEPNAFIIDSLKRGEEVDLLREIYGESLMVFGLQAKSKVRERALAERYRLERASMSADDLERKVSELIEQDLSQAEQNEYGQNVLLTFPMADVFIDTGGRTGHQVRRVVDLLFRNPQRPAATMAELAMSAADRVSATSPELGRRVGAVIVKENSIVSVGANVHPETTRIPAVDASVLDIHDIVGDIFRLLLADGAILSEDATNQLQRDRDSYVNRLLQNQLKKAKVRSLTEFQTTVHAEMNALMASLKLGIRLDGAHVFVTTFPCHNCAKHLVTLGLDVIYLEAYPRSRAEAMYGPYVRRHFKPFTGVAPRRFSPLFYVPEDRKAADGGIRPVDRMAVPNIPNAPSREEIIRRERLVRGAMGGSL